MKNLNEKTTLIIGIGNSGRQDDGLGWAFLDELEKNPEFQGQLIYRYQLNVEDADLIQEADTVIFVDAYKGEGQDDYSFQPLEPGGTFEFSSHALLPEVILALCQNLYNKYPSAYSFWIRGYEWELQTGLTVKAEQNLQKALEFFEKVIYGNVMVMK